MSLVQVLRILWARRLIIIAATVSCVIGALLVTLILPPRWEAHSRLILNGLRPDPVTGEAFSGVAAAAYIGNQTELVTDYTVAGPTVDRLGWLSDPVMIARYNHRSKSDKRDFRRWLSQLIIDNTKARVLSGSNILEISYTGTSPEQAKLVADTLRKAYIDTTLNLKREDAAHSAEWFEGQAQKVKVDLDQAIVAKAAYERENGIIVPDDGRSGDLETQRLQALSAAAQNESASPAIVGAAPAVAPGSMEIAQLDARIAEASRTLGPNHPELQAMRAQRASLAALAAKSQAAMREAVTPGTGALDKALQAQKAKVINMADKMGVLRQLQAQVELRREEYNRTLSKAADFRQVAASADAGITPLGAAVTPKDPSFPQPLLIFLGSPAMGLVVGLLAALLVELLGRRVRSAQDLETILQAPLLAVISAPAKMGA